MLLNTIARVLPQPAGPAGRVQGRPMSDAADLELLQRHEPILQFTRGELFYPDGRVGVRRAMRPARRADAPRRPHRRPGRQPGPRVARRRGEPHAGPGAVPAVRAQAVRLARARPVAQPPRPGAVLRARAARARRADRPPGGRGPRALAAAPGPRPRRHHGGGLRPLRRGPGHRPADGLPRPGGPGGSVGRPPLPVPVRHERLAVDVRWRQRPRGRLGAVLRRLRGAR